ncbi:MAG: CRISPR-associated protein Cas4 [Verrucomicrobiia bacterium]
MNTENQPSASGSGAGLPGRSRQPGGGRSLPPEVSRVNPPHEPGASAEARRVEIVLRIAPAEPSPPDQKTELPKPSPPEDGRVPAEPQPRVQADPSGSAPPAAAKGEVEQIPARMLNEFVYCRRLFYYEFVEGVFVESADTLRGAAIHRRVDTGNGALPKPKPKKGAGEPDAKPEASEPAASQGGEATEPETIHSRSVQMGSERLAVVAKMDLIEARTDKDDLFAALDVCPVDYKAGAPKEGADANELWDTDKMQLGLQALILRDNGYTCKEGIIYYRATKQRVRLAMTPDLERWVEENIEEARHVAKGPIPPPLTKSPKCVRCSLAPVCLPDETLLCATGEAEVPDRAGLKGQGGGGLTPPRRLIAARDDTRPLYLNTQGLRVGCKEEVLQVKDKERLVEEVRMRDLSHVALFGNIQITTQAVQGLCEQEVPLNHIQYSVFECDLNPAEKIELETTLSAVIKHDEDQVLFVELGPAEGRGDRVITSLGLPYTKLDAPCYVV